MQGEITEHLYQSLTPQKAAQCYLIPALSQQRTSVNLNQPQTNASMNKYLKACLKQATGRDCDVVVGPVQTDSAGNPVAAVFITWKGYRRSMHQLALLTGTSTLELRAICDWKGHASERYIEFQDDIRLDCIRKLFGVPTSLPQLWLCYAGDSPVSLLGSKFVTDSREAMKEWRLAQIHSAFPSYDRGSDITVQTMIYRAKQFLKLLEHFPTPVPGNFSAHPWGIVRLPLQRDLTQTPPTQIAMQRALTLLGNLKFNHDLDVLSKTAILAAGSAMAVAHAGCARSAENATLSSIVRSVSLKHGLGDALLQSAASAVLASSSHYAPALWPAMFVRIACVFCNARVDQAKLEILEARVHSMCNDVAGSSCDSTLPVSSRLDVDRSGAASMQSVSTTIDGAINPTPSVMSLSAQGSSSRVPVTVDALGVLRLPTLLDTARQNTEVSLITQVNKITRKSERVSIVSGSGNSHFRQFFSTMGGKLDYRNARWIFPESQYIPLCELLGKSQSSIAAQPLSGSSTGSVSFVGDSRIVDAPPALQSRSFSRESRSACPPTITLTPPKTELIYLAPAAGAAGSPTYRGLSHPEDLPPGIYPCWAFWHGLIEHWPAGFLSNSASDETYSSESRVKVQMSKWRTVVARIDAHCSILPDVVPTAEQQNTAYGYCLTLTDTYKSFRGYYEFVVNQRKQLQVSQTNVLPASQLAGSKRNR